MHGPRNIELFSGVVIYDFTFQEMEVRSKDNIIITCVGRTEFEIRGNVLIE